MNLKQTAEEQSELKGILAAYPDYFVNFPGDTINTEGWKISIQGKSLDDVVYLVEHLFPLLSSTHVFYKIGTQKLIDLGEDHEQSTKLMTIYLPNGVDPRSFAELVRINLGDYHGGDGIDYKKSYVKYCEGVFFRNDRDANGNYIPADNESNER